MVTNDSAQAAKEHDSKDPSIAASHDLSFDQKKGKFTEGAVRTTPDRLEKIRKDALDDFKRSTEARDQSVHQMAAKLASSAAEKSEGSTKPPAREETSAVGGEIGAAGGEAQPRFEEMLNLTSNRKLHVKDIASGFKGESRPENMEAFFVRHAQQEAAYRHKVHEGRETLKNTSQATDAMYDFVFKLNLSTTEGKERFLRKWAVGRMANGQSTSPREGWKFLKSIGVDVPLPESRTSTTPPEGLSPAGAPSATPPRGRTRTRISPVSRGKPAASGSTKKKRGAKPESVAWEEALSRAVGAVSKVDADACAPKLANPRLRKSGSEPRYGGRSPPQFPETCRGPRTRAFFGAAADYSLAFYQSEDEGAGREERQRSSWSPIGSSSGRRASIKLWQRDSTGPLSQCFRANGDSIERRVSVASRPSVEPPYPDTPTTGRGMMLSLNPLSGPPGRFSLSPVRTSDNSRSSFMPSDQADVSAASALSAKVSWDHSPPPQDLRLPGRLFDSGEEENESSSESWGVPSVEIGSPITPSCHDDRAPDENDLDTSPCEQGAPDCSPENVGHAPDENPRSPQQKEGDDFNLLALEGKETEPADAGARQPITEMTANSASSSPRVQVSSPWRAFATDIVSPLSPTMTKFSSDLTEALEISRHSPLSVSPRIIVAASPASSFSSEASSLGADSRDLGEASEKVENDNGASDCGEGKSAKNTASSVFDDDKDDVSEEAGGAGLGEDKSSEENPCVRAKITCVDSTRSPEAGVEGGEDKSSEEKPCEQGEGVKPPMPPQVNARLRAAPPQSPYVDFDALDDTENSKERDSANMDCLGNFMNFCRPYGRDRREDGWACVVS